MKLFTTEISPIIGPCGVVSGAVVVLVVVGCVVVELVLVSNKLIMLMRLKA